MAQKKIKLTRPELKRLRDALARFERYLPMLKLKQQQLQLMVRQIERKQRELAAAAAKARRTFDRYKAVLGDVAGLNVRQLAAPSEVKVASTNVAGVTIPVFEGASFPEARYSLFATPPWVDAVLAALRDLNRKQAELDVVAKQHRLVKRELTKIIQRVNLFEKVKIPEVSEAIRVIRIHLGDEMTAAVGRAKIAKSKLGEKERASGERAVEAGVRAPQEVQAP